ncbi:MAG: DUF1572 family protein [Gemmatimonadota bacterium]
MPGADLVDSATRVFRKQKAVGDQAMAQLPDEKLFMIPDPGSNSIAVIVHHMYGNMRSRWTDFLTTDGEKPDRNRDGEFDEPGNRTRGQVDDWWNQGWECVFAALAELGPGDLDRMVSIRGEKLTVTAAILRSIDHYGQHVGQIIYLARHLAGEQWRTLSIPRGGSAAFNAPAAAR